MTVQTHEFREHDGARQVEAGPLEAGSPDPIRPPHPLEQGYTPELPPQPEGDPPEGPDWEWIPTEWIYYPNEDFDNPVAVTERYYKWVSSPRHIPTPAELAREAAAAQLEALAARRAEIEAIIAAPVVRSVTLAGITLARFDDTDRLRRNQAALAALLLDVMEASRKVLEAATAEMTSTSTGAGTGVGMADRPTP